MVAGGQASEATLIAGSECRRWGIRGLAVGISLGGPGASCWDRQLEWVDRAERLGAHSIWLPEMHFAEGTTPSPLLGLAAMAARTKRVRLGTSSLLLPIHSPLHIAESVAALDRASGGRALLGMGRGFRPALFHAFGIDATTKRDLFDKGLDAMLECWRGEDRRFETVQHPHPPLAVAAFGRKGLLQSARRGLPYLASPLESLSLLAENFQFHRDNTPPEARAEDPAIPVLRTLHVAADDAEARRVRDALEGEGRRLRGGVSRVPKALARAAEAPVEERTIVGMRNAVIDAIAEYREKLGMNLLITRPQIAGASSTEQEAAFHRLFEEVLPAHAA